MKIPVKQYIALLRDYLRPQWIKVMLLAVLLVGSIALRLYDPQIVRAFIDGAVEGVPTGDLFRLALIFLGATLGAQVMTALARYVGGDVAWTATNHLRQDLVAHCLGLDLSFHKTKTPGEMIERIDGDVATLSEFFSQFAIDLLGSVAMLVGVIALLFQVDWRVGLALTAFAMLAIYLLIFVHGISTPHFAADRQASARFFGFLGERLAGTEDTKANGAASYVMRRFLGMLQEWFPLRRRAMMWGAGMWMTSLAVFSVGDAVVFGLGGYLLKAGAITIGTVYLIWAYTERLNRPLQQIRTQLQNLQRAGAGITRVNDLLAFKSKIPDTGTGQLPSSSLPVEFDRVSFSYDGTDLALDEISFRLEPGKVMGLLGRTGSGKTTLARLLLRFYDVTVGEVRLGGLPAPAVPLSHLRERVGIVTQDVQLFEGTVRDNLTFFNRSIPDERVVAVVEEIGMGPWLRSMPNGLDTELGAGGGLSAGESQLLAFARLFLSDPGLVIMDEASSRLDPATEHLIERAVTKLLAGRTAIIIAHRLATIQRADEIMILENGRVLEHGNRVSLAATPTTRFAQLLQTGLEEVLV